MVIFEYFKYIQNRRICCQKFSMKTKYIKTKLRTILKNYQLRFLFFKHLLPEYLKIFSDSFRFSEPLDPLSLLFTIHKYHQHLFEKKEQTLTNTRSYTTLINSRKIHTPLLYDHKYIGKVKLTIIVLLLSLEETDALELPYLLFIQLRMFHIY